MRAGLAVAAIAAVVAVFASSASGFDRQPIRVVGLTPDNWSQTITNAERQLHARFPGIRNVVCTGAIMVGYESISSFLAAGVRWWDKLVCGGTLWRRPGFIALIFDAKGKSALSWTIYRLKGASVPELYG